MKYKLINFTCKSCHTSFVMGYCGRRNWSLLCWELRAVKGCDFKIWRTSESSFACFAYCQEICLSNFCLPDSFNFFSPLILFQCKVTHVINSESDLWFNKLFRPDMIFAVDWVLNINNNSPVGNSSDLHFHVACNYFSSNYNRLPVQSHCLMVIHA